jgi:hypothetical protein
MQLLDFRFKYKRWTTLDCSTNERREIFYPFVPCIISSNNGIKIPVEGLLDSGSDGIVLPRRMAGFLGLDLKKAEPLRVPGSRANRSITKVSISLGRAGRLCSPIEDVEASVLEGDDTLLILGRNPIFKLYRITFIEPEYRFEMTPYRTEIGIGHPLN